jgi:hypothetical protein
MMRLRCPRCGRPGTVGRYSSGAGVLTYFEHVERVGWREVRARCYLGWVRRREEDVRGLAEASRKWWECIAGRWWTRLRRIKSAEGEEVDEEELEEWEERWEPWPD